jgi:hypothetical protein
VKVCALYGAGFYYIPGTDTCLKIGGFVRADWVANAGGSHTPYWNVGNGIQNRNTDDLTTRTRFMTSFDARTQTEYGTLRSYIRAGYQYTTDNSDKSGAIYVDRGFIQLGGFTFGKTVSFYDAFGGGPASFTTLVGSSDSGQGINQIAYTAMFGNGFSGSIAIEDPTYRRQQTGILNGDLNVGTAAAPLLGLAGQAGVPSTAGWNYGGVSAPDIVGNLRVDQAWGSAQLSAAAHQVRAQYYSLPLGSALEANGNPGDKWGFAVQGAVQVNLPWSAGDKFTVQGGYAEGANHYVYLDSQTFGMWDGSKVFEGLNYEAVFANQGDLQLTKAYGFNASLEHYWTPALRSSLFGAYLNVDYNDTASGIICNTTAYRNSAAGSCNPDWQMYMVGSRTVWNPVKNLDVGVEVLYTKMEGKHGAGAVRTSTAGLGKAAGDYQLGDTDALSAIFRVQRNFWP